MNRYVKDFLIRGLMFSGFGPIVAGIVYFCISLAIKDFSLTGREVLLAIVSTYILAFLQAGASVFNQIEHWSTAKCIACHFGTIYIAYSLCYILNSWIPFEPMVLVIFTAAFIVLYAIIWLTVMLCVRSTAEKMNQQL